MNSFGSSSAAVAPSRSRSPEEVRPVPTRLLIVDDVEDNRVILTRRFHSRGFSVVEAESGPRALALLEKGNFDLVLLDVRMPDMDGVEVLRRIRKFASADELPVIMCTANNSSAEVVEALQAGANDYVAKPIDFAVALARVNVHVQHKRANAKLFEAYATLNEMNGDLERRVSERTSELAAINDRLQLEILKRRQSDAETQYLAYHDALTGLGNRVTFRDAAQGALQRSQESGAASAIFFLDLDGFKAVNDTLGHSIGDALLKAVAVRLRDKLPANLTITRLGGDEFGILMTDCRDADSAIIVANRVISMIGEPFFVEGHSLSVSASVGIAFAMKGENSVDEVLKRADLAMYRAKEDGRGVAGPGAYRLFDATMDNAAQRAMQLNSEMRSALARGEFRVHFQPIVALASRRVTAFEALIRWQHPSLGLLGPSQFIPLAESTRYIIQIGEWVLKEACREATRWPDDIKVTVNLSPVQFQRGDIVAVVIGALAHSGLPSHRLELEITESIMLDKTDRNVRILENLRAIGATISMDDFGTGFSSLSYLRTFPFDKIKIDQSFVQTVLTDHRSLDIISAITGLGRSFGMKTVAEGVESEAQLEVLAKEGCSEVQGRYYSMPIAPADIATFLETTSH